jgi:uridine kinase
MYTIELNNKLIKYEKPMILKEIADNLGIDGFVAKVNNRLRELSFTVDEDAKVEFLSLNEYEAVRVYETSLRYLTIMALERLYPGIDVKFLQCVSSSLSCHIKNLDLKIDLDFITKLETKMRELIALDIPIIRKSLPKSEAYKLYEKRDYIDKCQVLDYRPEDTVNIYECDGYINYMFGYMVPSTKYLTKFKLRLYYPDFVIQYPRAEWNGEIPEFEDSAKFGKMLAEAQEWASTCDGDSISKMNSHSINNTTVEFVNMCETRQNDLLADLGLTIKRQIGNIRLIAIAGPSSSGKTTFSNRLRIELMTRGIKPVKISMDDYYKNRESAPLDENGDPDLEHIESLDIALFNKHLLALIQGKKVTLPKFDFKSGHRLDGETIQVNREQPIIIEGIHALNEVLTSSIPKHLKFKIYISPLTQINIDDHSPISATDIRLLRRIVRDGRTRNSPAEETLAMWSSVRRGEFKWIYKFQEQADFVFNTELTYELGVMKKYALPVLSAIDHNSEFYIPANRLIKFLKYFTQIDDVLVPSNSILREFIGGSSFHE